MSLPIPPPPYSEEDVNKEFDKVDDILKDCQQQLDTLPSQQTSNIYPVIYSVPSDAINPTGGAAAMPKDEDEIHIPATKFHSYKIGSLALQMADNKDKRCYGFFMMLVLGIIALLPWNMMLVLSGYFISIIRDRNETGGLSPESFMGYFNIASQSGNLLATLVCLYVSFDYSSLWTRMIGSIWGMIGASCACVIGVGIFYFGQIELFAEPLPYFIIVYGGILMMCFGFLQNSTFTFLANMSKNYTHAYSMGMDISGAVASLISLVFYLMVNDKTKEGSIAFYAMISFIGLLMIYCVILRGFPPKVMEQQQQLMMSVLQTDGDVNLTVREIFRDIIRVVKLIKYKMLAIFMTYMITFTVFPVVMSEMEPKTVGTDRAVFTIVGSFMMFSIFSMLGNLTALNIRPRFNVYSYFLIYIRILFVPFFFFCNFRPLTRSLPIYIEYDYIYFAGVILFGYSLGFCSDLIMSNAPKTVYVTDARKCGTIMGTTLVVGLSVGSLISRFIIV